MSSVFLYYIKFFNLRNLFDFEHIVFQKRTVLYIALILIDIIIIKKNIFDDPAKSRTIAG